MAMCQRAPWPSWLFPKCTFFSGRTSPFLCILVEAAFDSRIWAGNCLHGMQGIQHSLSGAGQLWECCVMPLTPPLPTQSDPGSVPTSFSCICKAEKLSRGGGWGWFSSCQHWKKGSSPVLLLPNLLCVPTTEPLFASVSLFSGWGHTYLPPRG